jgi:hypothetical protein
MLPECVDVVMNERCESRDHGDLSNELIIVVSKSHLLLSLARCRDHPVTAEELPGKMVQKSVKSRTIIL